MRIYHYTDLNGLKGIIENHSLWATNFFFLNDSEELRHGIRAFRNALEYLSDDLNEKSINILKNEIIRFNMHRANHQYNISFCEEPDLLSQWRGYGATQGVCLEFESDELIQSLIYGNAQVLSGPVIYTKPDSTLEAKKEIINFLRDEKLIKKIEVEPMYEIISAIDIVHKLPPFLKNDRFSEEKEFRIVVQPNQPYEDVKFRVNAYGVIPYLELNANKNNMWNGRLPLKSIKIGPAKEKAFLWDGIKFLLQSKGYGNVDFSFTETPFRS